MKSKARVLLTLKGEKPDRVPYFELGYDIRFAQKLLGKENFTPFEVAKKLNLDAIPVDCFPPIFAEKKMDDEGREIIIAGKIRSEEDLKTMQFPDPADERLYAPIKELIKNNEREYGGEYAIFARTRLGISPLLLSIGIENFSYALVDNIDLINGFLERYSNWAVQIYRHLNEIGIDFLSTHDDIALKTGPLISPITFRNVILPWVKRTADSIKIPWIYHSDGNIMPLIDDLLTLGMSGIANIEPAAMDINEVKKKYGSRVCLMGNIDMDMLARGTKEEVINEVKKRLKEVAPEGGYILASGNGLASYLKVENVLAMAETNLKFGKYPISL